MILSIDVTFLQENQSWKNTVSLIRPDHLHPFPSMLLTLHYAPSPVRKRGDPITRTYDTWLQIKALAERHNFQLIA